VSHSHTSTVRTPSNIQTQTITLPVQHHNPNYIAEISNLFEQVGAEYTKKLQGVGGQTLVIQPFPKIFGKHSEARGGNALALSSTDHDRFVLEIAGLYSNKLDDALMIEWGRKFTNKLLEDLKIATVGIILFTFTRIPADQDQADAKAKGISVGEYNPYFINYAGPDQDVFASYKHHEKFKRLQREIDPLGLFSKRAGGYKFP
jgi:hypothetical protein